MLWATGQVRRSSAKRSWALVKVSGSVGSKSWVMARTVRSGGRGEAEGQVHRAVHGERRVDRFAGALDARRGGEEPPQHEVGLEPADVGAGAHGHAVPERDVAFLDRKSVV